MKKLVLILFLIAPFYSLYANTKQVSLDEKIGQMIIIGFSGTSMNEELRSYITEYKVGGLIFMNRSLHHSREPNIVSKEQLNTLIEDIKQLDSSLFLSVDQEGGMVARLRANNGFKSTITHQEMAKLSNQEAYNNAKEIAVLVKENGFNVNFAPVVDVNDDDNPIIGKIKRAFSENPQEIVKFANIYVQAHHEEGLITSIKHFPGHGSSKEDTHKQFVDISNTWNEKELIPYQELINNGYNDIVMIGHVYNKNLDSKMPASMSKEIITGLLRNKLKYKGVIATDSMDMRAISDNYSLKEMVINSINAGVDIIIYANNIDKEYDPTIVNQIHTIIKNAINSGEITESRINESYNRIINLKQRYGIN